jgi:DNA-binding beta-propeller fold protein YncE
VINATTRRIVARVPVGKAPHGLAFTPDGHLMAVNDARPVAVVDTTTDRVVATILVPGTAGRAAASGWWWAYGILAGHGLP